MMAPKPLDAATARRMTRQRRSGTAPELAIRKRLHEMGFRYRVHVAPAGGPPRRRADIVFTRQRVAVFVDGCFWHACPVHRTLPTNNSEWWRTKLEANVRRDRETDALLEASGWSVVRIWEHESVDDAVLKVTRAIEMQRLQCS